MARPATVVVLLVLAACGPARGPMSVSAELGAVPAGAARVCVLRPADVAPGSTMEVRDNGRLVAATRGRTFACWLAAPGRHQITSIDDDTGPSFLAAQGGRHYWLHQDVSTLDEGLHAHLDWVDDAVATEMIERCSGRVLVNVPGYESRADAVAIAPATR